MPVSSRAKGKRGELQWAKVLRKFGCVNARRGVQYAGGPDSPDVVDGIPNTHAEVKRCERLRLWEAMDQAANDARTNVPYVAHKANGKPWVIIVRADDLPRFVRCYAAIEGRPIYPEDDE